MKSYNDLKQQTLTVMCKVQRRKAPRVSMQRMMDNAVETFNRYADNIGVLLGCDGDGITPEQADRKFPRSAYAKY